MNMSDDRTANDELKKEKMKEEKMKKKTMKEEKMKKKKMKKKTMKEEKMKKKMMKEEMMKKKKMKEQMKKKQKKGFIRDIIILVIVLIITFVLLMVFPENKGAVGTHFLDFLIEMMLILPAVMILLGLFAVWVPNETVVKYLGHSSGIRGIILAIILGAIPTGPLYIAFPMAAVLLKKGAKRSSIIVFLSAWACIKIPQEMVELQYLGIQFMLLRLALTIVFVIIMGISIEKIMELSDKKKNNSLEV